jgi:hypothetical protein
MISSGLFPFRSDDFPCRPISGLFDVQANCFQLRLTPMEPISADFDYRPVHGRLGRYQIGHGGYRFVLVSRFREPSVTRLFQCH